MIAVLDRARRGDDGGFALIFTLFVTTMIMIGVAATLTITTPNIVGSKTGQDSSAALLAAESGIQDAVAYLTSVPACRSETRICPQALGANSAAQGMNRPSLGGNQSFHWTTASSAVPLRDNNGNIINSDGFVRVTSTGTEGVTRRTLTADLSLNPSILAYGYYTDYESQSPTFFNSYYGKRSIDITSSASYSDVDQVTTKNYSLPQVIAWAGAGSSAQTGYPDSVCAQHWYNTGSTPGRANATHGSTWYESGTLNNQTVYHGSSCDLVFTTGMTENGPTYTRDALDIANGSGTGPVFKQPVYTLWGYGSNTSPAPPSGQPWRQSDGQGKDTLASSTYKPQIATQDITLPPTIGSAGVETNSCVYYGPTRVYLNGDGTATVTSPETTPATLTSSTADSGCYPNNLGTSGVVGFRLNYNAIGSSTIYVKNLSTPSSGTWPLSTLKSTSTPSSSNEVFWVPVSGTVAPDASSSVTPFAGCSSTVSYSAATNATCAWTNVPNGSTASASQGWTSYSSGSNCNSSSLTAADRQLFECEYSNTTGAAKPPSDQYASFRSTVQSYLAGKTCSTDTIAAQQSCIVSGLDTGVLPTANTGKHTYNYGSPANGDHQYYATTSTGTVTNANKSLGGTPANPTAGDSMFTYNGSPGQEQSTATPINVTVYRQVYSSSNHSWGNGVAQFTFTITHTDWTVTTQPSGVSSFPNVQDVTQYATGADQNGNAAGSTGQAQPGDLYVEGVNSGSLSLIAQNNVEITGNITKGAGNDSSTNSPLSITAGNDVRNYHPVSCTDQTAADINATSPGWCPNDITGATSASLLNSDGSFMAQHPAAQYVDMPTTSSNSSGIGDRTIDAAIFALTGSLRTDNYDRGNFVGNLVVNGGIYQSHRGANGVSYSNGSNPVGRTGTSLNYNYVDLERADLQYVPSANYSSNPRVWNVVSISAASNPPAGT